MEFDYQISVITGTKPSAKDLVRARRTMRQWRADRAKFSRRAEVVRQLAATQPGSAQATILRNFLLSSASKDLHDEAAKLQREAAEIRSHLHTSRQDRELADQEALCASLATATSWDITENAYAQALDKLEQLQQREAVRSAAGEAKATKRLAELTAELNAVQSRMLVPENLAMASEAKANTIT